MDLTQARSEFPITRSWIYLDNATYGPNPQPYVDAVSSTAARLADEPIGNSVAQVEEVREVAARLIHASPSSVSFLHNTGEGSGLIAHGLDWKSGDEVIMYEYEHPSAVSQFRALGHLGVRVIEIPDRGRHRFDLDDVANAITPRTRVICVSLVNYSSGFRAPIAEIRRLCAGRDIWIICDAVQAMGSLDINVQELGADIVTAHGYKFLVSGHGNAVVYFSDRVRDEIRVTNVGSRNAGRNSRGLFDEGVNPPAGGRRFETAEFNLPSVMGMGASIGLLADVGTEVIEHHVLKLSSRLIDGARSRGYEVATPDSSADRSAVVSVVPRGSSPQELHENLRKHRVLCAVRNDRLRFACHLFNTEDEIDELVAALP